MTKQQKVAAILLPLLALAILFGGDMVFGGPESAFYEGSAEGYAGEIRVKVEIAAGEILSIDILEINDTPGLGDNAARTVADSIIEAQSTDVDVVSGATMSSLGTINAVEAALAQAPPVYPDGTHEGVGEGYNGEIKVNVTVANGAIKSIEVVEISDTPGLGDAAANTIAERIVETQSTEVDVVTNATASSRGMMQAVRDALGIVDEEDEVEEVFAPVIITVADGEYEGTARGYDGAIKVKVVIAGGEIADIQLVEINDTPGLGDSAANKTIEKILSTQSVEIDAISGATGSSKGTINAVKDALAESYPDGEYEGTASGYDGPIKVKVVVENSRLKTIELLEINDTPGLGDKTANKVIDNMLSAGSVNVDTVTGATGSSQGTINAVKNALGL